jgi:hypothetical protein
MSHALENATPITTGAASLPMIRWQISARTRLLLTYVSAAIVAMLVFWNGVSMGRVVIAQGHDAAFSRAYTADDIDRWKIMANVMAVHSLAGVSRWWIGPWCGWGAYWRPLTSTAFWLEAHLFSPDRANLWEWALIGANLIFSGLLGVFAYTITRRRDVAILSAFFFAGFRQFSILTGLASYIGNPGEVLLYTPADVGLTNWIDQPEMWYGIFALAALIFAWRGAWWGAVACVPIAVGFKEPGWFILPMIFFTLLIQGRLRKVPWTVYAGVALVCVVLIAVRALSGHAVLTKHLGWSNRSWPLRYGTDVAGCFLDMLTSPSFQAPLLSLLLFLSALAPCPRLWQRAGMALAAFVCTALISAWIRQIDLVTASAMLVLPECGSRSTIGFLPYLTMFWFGMQRPEVRYQCLILAPLILITAISEAIDLQSKSDHVNYLTAAFQSILIASIFLGALREIAARMAAQKERKDAFETSPTMPP